MWELRCLSGSEARLHAYSEAAPWLKHAALGKRRSISRMFIQQVSSRESECQGRPLRKEGNPVARAEIEHRVGTGCELVYARIPLGLMAQEAKAPV